MRINIKAKDMELTPAIESYLADKLTQVEKFVQDRDDGALADVEVGKTTRHHRSGDVFLAEINLQDRGKLLRASVTREDLYGAIDEMKDEIISQIKSHQDRRLDLVKKGGRLFKQIFRGA